MVDNILRNHHNMASKFDEQTGVVALVLKNCRQVSDVALIALRQTENTAHFTIPATVDEDYALMKACVWPTCMKSKVALHSTETDAIKVMVVLTRPQMAAATL